MNPFLRRYGFRIAVVVGVLWVGGASWAISRAPAPGAADPVGLATAYQRGLAVGDIEYLLYDPPRGTGDRLVAALATACGTGARVRASGAVLALSTVDGRDCGRLPIAQHDGRWYVDPWTTVNR